MLKRALLEKAKAILDWVEDRRVIEYGPNGNARALETALALLMGKEVSIGTFSGDTGYSGWWSEYQITPEGRLRITKNLSDTMHFDPEKVEVLEKDDWKKLVIHLLEDEKASILARLPYPSQDIEELKARAWLTGTLKTAMQMEGNPNRVVEWTESLLEAYLQNTRAA